MALWSRMDHPRVLLQMFSFESWAWKIFDSWHYNLLFPSQTQLQGIIYVSRRWILAVFFLAAKVFLTKKRQENQPLKNLTKPEICAPRFYLVNWPDRDIQRYSWQVWGSFEGQEMEVSNSIQMHSIRMFRRDSHRDSGNPRGTFHNLYHTKGQYWCNQPLDWWLNRVPCTWWLNWWVSLTYYRDLWFHKW